MKEYIEPAVRNYDVELETLMNDMSVLFGSYEDKDDYDSDKSKERNPFSFGDENDFGFGE